MYTAYYILQFNTLLQVAATVDSETGEIKMRENFSYDESQRTVKITTEGTCRAVYGVEQVHLNPIHFQDNMFLVLRIVSSLKSFFLQVIQIETRSQPVYWNSTWTLHPVTTRGRHASMRRSRMTSVMTSQKRPHSRCLSHERTIATQLLLFV